MAIARTEVPPHAKGERKETETNALSLGCQVGTGILSAEGVCHMGKGSLWLILPDTSITWEGFYPGGLPGKSRDSLMVQALLLNSAH